MNGKRKGMQLKNILFDICKTTEKEYCHADCLYDKRILLLGLRSKTKRTKEMKTFRRSRVV